MEHPFLSSKDLDDKSIEELQDSISSIMNKLTFAYRTQNGPLIHQLQLAINTYKEEYAKKMDEMMSKQKISTKVSIQKDNK